MQDLLQELDTGKIMAPQATRRTSKLIVGPRLESTDELIAMVKKRIAQLDQQIKLWDAVQTASLHRR